MKKRPSLVADLPKELELAIASGGYHPAVVADTARRALVGEPLESFLVHQETMFDPAESLRRHLSVLLLTPTRLVVVHADDTDQHGLHMGRRGLTLAATSAESVALSSVNSVVLSTVVHHPESFAPGDIPDEVTITLCWGTMTRVDLEPADCPDPQCNADHGFTGVMTRDDMVVRVSRAADGDDALHAALDFASSVHHAIGPRP